MSLQVGYIDSVGHPRIRVRVHGPDPNNSHEEDALIDTGFTGFLMLPLIKALALGMMPSGVAEYTLADESKVNNFLSTATITVGASPPTNTTAMPAPLVAAAQMLVQPEIVTGVVVMCGDGALVGMEFIRALKKLLMVGEFVMLVDHDEITQSFENTPPPAAPDAT
jgi:hypothetical protein